MPPRALGTALVCGLLCASITETVPSSTPAAQRDAELAAAPSQFDRYSVESTVVEVGGFINPSKQTAQIYCACASLAKSLSTHLTAATNQRVCRSGLHAVQTRARVCTAWGSR